MTPFPSIDIQLVQALIASQFPNWKNLPITSVAVGGWDNHTFHLGDDMLVRMPKDKAYACQVEKEQTWLPRLAPSLPLAIPKPLAMGKPDYGYPWNWSIYWWIPGETVAVMPVMDKCDCAIRLAQFLLALESIDPTGGPHAGEHSFYRGGSLEIYEVETRRSIDYLKAKIDTRLATEVWELALRSKWTQPGVWVHGDLSAGNLLVQKGCLAAVLDFGQVAVGDPACDLAVTWTLFSGESRELFRSMLTFDEGTWARGRAWTLWKALVVAAGFTNPNNAESQRCWYILDDILTDYKQRG